MSITVLFPLLFASPQPACAVQGTPLLEMRQASTRDAASTTTRIYRTGAFTISGATTQTGCFDRAELRSIRNALQRASWKTVASPVACFAYDPNVTEYRVNGRLRFTEQFCSGKAADPTTARAIDLVNKELAEEAPPPPKPPVVSCRPVGTPLFEIRKRADAALPTSTLALYATGAWTFQPIDAAGHLDAVTSGCLPRSTLASLRTEIAAAPWDTELAGLTCKAYSATFTEYFVNGRREYTARLCGNERLDQASLAAIKQIEGSFAKLIPSQETPAGCE